MRAMGAGDCRSNAARDGRLGNATTKSYTVHTVELAASRVLNSAAIERNQLLALAAMALLDKC